MTEVMVLSNQTVNLDSSRFVVCASCLYPTRFFVDQLRLDSAGVLRVYCARCRNNRNFPWFQSEEDGPYQTASIIDPELSPSYSWRNIDPSKLRAKAIINRGWLVKMRFYPPLSTKDPDNQVWSECTLSQAQEMIEITGWGKADTANGAGKIARANAWDLFEQFYRREIHARDTSL